MNAHNGPEAALEIEVWSDVVCPFCYIGKRRVEKVAQAYGRPVHVTYRSFQLAEDAPRQTDETMNSVLERKLGLSAQQLKESNIRVSGMGTEFGISFNFAATRYANTYDAHRLIQLAGDHGRQGDVAEALFKAYFTDGGSIGDPVALRKIAIDAGLPADAVDRVLASDDYADAIARDREEARAIGLRGVPFYRIAGRTMGSESITPATFAQLAATTR